MNEFVIKIEKSLTFLDKTLSCLGFACFSASDLIKRHTLEIRRDKVVSDIARKQAGLIIESMQELSKYRLYALDGHFTFLSKEGSVQPIPREVFSALKLDCLILILASVCLSLYLNITCFACIISYFILNVFYSLYLKHIELIDVACIALGFVLRIISGGFAIEVEPSALIILLTFFTSMFFTFSKRKMELLLLGENRRKSILKMTLETINQYIVINAVLAIAFYFTYVMDDATIQRAGTKYLYISVIPFTLIFFRLLYLNSLTSNVDDPIIYIEKDKSLKVLFVVYLIVLLLILLFLK